MKWFKLLERKYDLNTNKYITFSYINLTNMLNDIVTNCANTNIIFH